MGEISKVAAMKTCGICFEEKAVIVAEASIYESAIKCSGRPHPFCQDCIVKHILHQITAKNGIIRCPGELCPAKLNPILCRSLIPTHSFVEWCDLLVDTWIAEKGHRRSVCPYEGCSEPVVDECEGAGARQECPKCGRAFCFGCGAVWCMTHLRVCAFDEKMFLKAAKAHDWKRCPVCRFFVERRSGCNYMTCRCGTKFCYNCGRQGCDCLRRQCNDLGRFCCVCLLVIIAIILTCSLLALRSKL